MNYQELKNVLPHGAITQISKQLALSPTTIILSLQGKQKSSKEPEILQACADVIREHKERTQKAQKAIAEALAK